jgi:hypothetical protein
MKKKKQRKKKQKRKNQKKKKQSPFMVFMAIKKVILFLLFKIQNLILPFRDW